MLKQLAAHLPARWQDELKRHYFGRQIRRGTFATGEPEFALLDRFVGPGDWAIDIGANIGQYTKRLSDLVGPSGRVIAFEPVPATFSLLAANSMRFRYRNTSLFNVAISDSADLAGIEMPDFPSGLANFYEARLAPAEGHAQCVLKFALDCLPLAHPIALVKADVEGHEACVLTGMRHLVMQHHPVLVIETTSEAVIASVRAFGYRAEHLPGSPNMLFTPCPHAAA
ncbi:MAG: FkbM family methyltransferase [Xanthomonadales bacterium]|nr:FkbM family methyltransferase [Xanthomonadales bacterium]